ncbi:NAD(P)/FAD-dependent oxidoreductase [Conexibacter sp. DBS9H8]|uniref:dihydrolipoyl dehydrogenase family protein n=1 Tax=Conexibacter sp. DBS9H8 TaxID=2937801 RepID=UPI00200F41EF|nr:NAD(P)/FAD-dependent oxidoreductase [Conexibacter sp. DBS9H8]
MSGQCDAIVIGAGPVGEVAASRLNRDGLNTALVERELIGGECGYWACIPSKTLLRPAEVRGEAERTAGTSAPDQRWPEVAAYRDFMIRHLDDSAQVTGYERDGVRVYKGDGRHAGPGRVEVAGELLETRRVVIATGSDARIPDIPGLAEAGYWTNREATTIQEIPDSILILGGGPVGIELGQFLRRIGTDVTLIQAAERLLPREDPRVGELIAEQLRSEGIALHLGASVVSASAGAGRRTLTLADGQTLSATEVLIATGRAPRVNDIGLETIGITPDPRGIPIDERCRVTDGVWAIGDVTGVMPFTHVGMYQGRITCADIAGRAARADYSAIPRVVFCDPEVAAVGLSADQATERGIAVRTATVALADAIARPWTYQKDPGGELGIIADRDSRTLIGAWAVGPLAGEWIHYATLAIKTRAGIDVLSDTVAQFPTYTEAYLKAIEQLDL